MQSWAVAHAVEGCVCADGRPAGVWVCRTERMDDCCRVEEVSSRRLADAGLITEGVLRSSFASPGGTCSTASGWITLDGRMLATMYECG